MEFGFIRQDITAGKIITPNVSAEIDSNLKFRFTVVRYDASNNVLETENIDETVNYSGGQVSESGYKITSFPTSTSVQFNIGVIKKETVSSTPVAYTKVFFSLQENKERNNLHKPDFGSIYGYPIETNIAGTSNNTYVKVKLDSLQFNVQSSVLNEAVDITKKDITSICRKGII